MKTTQTRPVAILGGLRLPFCRMATAYSDLGNQELMTEVLKETVKRFQLQGQTLGEVVLGTVFFHPSLWNFARDVTLKSGLSQFTPAIGMQRACATSLDASILVANKIALGQIEVGIAGGVESMSTISLYYHPELAKKIIKVTKAKTWTDRISVLQGFNIGQLKPLSPAPFEPSTGRSMGEHCEMMAKEWQIPRSEQDQLALTSHQNGASSFQHGFYSDLVMKFQGIEQDNNIRSDTSMEKLAKLSPAFDRTGTGTLTAGNSSPLTDGAACVLLASEEWAKKNRFPIQAYLTHSESAAIPLREEGLLMAPAYAAAKLLQRVNRKLQDFDYYEIHEAFAAQVLCTLKAWESEKFCKNKLGLETSLGAISKEKLNVAGGSVALGHPFGATGARMIATLAKLLQKKGGGRGFLSICTGGGMGTVATLET